MEGGDDNCVNDTWELVIEHEKLLTLIEALSLSPRELRPPLSARGSGSGSGSGSVASTSPGNRSRSTSASTGAGASASPGAGIGTRASLPSSPTSPPGSPAGGGTASGGPSRGGMVGGGGVGGVGVGGGSGSPILRHSPRSPDHSNHNNNNNHSSNNSNNAPPSPSPSPPSSSGSGLQATWKELHCTGPKPQARYNHHPIIIILHMDTVTHSY